MTIHEGRDIGINSLMITRFHILMLEINEVTKQHIHHYTDIKELIFQNPPDEMLNVYQKIADEFGDDMLMSFKRELARMQTCGIQIFSITEPLTARMIHHNCKGRSCPKCSPYQASYRLHYPKDICRITVFDDERKAKIVTNELKEYFSDYSPWLVVTSTPLSNGEMIVRVSNLRPDEASELLEPNEVQQSLMALDEIQPMEAVSTISHPNSTEIRYRTDSGFEFTTTQLYQAKPIMKKGKREGGTRIGFEFNSETGKIEHYTRAQKKEKVLKEQGIISSVNNPVIPLELVSKDTLKKALTETLNDLSSYPGKAVFSIASSDEYRKLINDIAFGLHENLGLPSDNIMYETAYITQEAYTEFVGRHATNSFAVSPTELDTELDLEEFANCKTLKGKFIWYKRLQQQKNKDIINAAPTIEEAVDKMLEAAFS